MQHGVLLGGEEPLVCGPQSAEVFGGLPAAGEQLVDDVSDGRHHLLDGRLGPGVALGGATAAKWRLRTSAKAAVARLPGGRTLRQSAVPGNCRTLVNYRAVHEYASGSGGLCGAAASRRRTARRPGGVAGKRNDGRQAGLLAAAAESSCLHLRPGWGLTGFLRVLLLPTLVDVRSDFQGVPGLRLAVHTPQITELRAWDRHGRLVLQHAPERLTSGGRNRTACTWIPTGVSATGDANRAPASPARTR